MEIKFCNFNNKNLRGISFNFKTQFEIFAALQHL